MTDLMTDTGMCGATRTPGGRVRCELAAGHDKDDREHSGRNARRRWITWPVDDIDEVAVLRAMDGQPPEHMTGAERAEAVKRLNQSGLSDRRIAERVGVTEHTVFRIRERYGIPGVKA